MKTVVEATVKGKQYRGTIVGFTASDTASFAIFVCDDKLIEAPIKDCKVITFGPESIVPVNSVS